MADEIEIGGELDSEVLPSPETSDVVDLRLDLVSDLEEKMLKEGLTSGSTKERLSLFQEVITHDDLNEAQNIKNVLSSNLESIESESINALQSLAEASAFSGAFMLAKNQAESPSIHSLGELVQLAGYAETPVHRKLVESWKLLADNPDSALSKLFLSEYLPEVLRETNALAKATLDASSFMSGAPGKAAGWVKDQFKERPVVAGSLALAGGLGLGALIYRTMRKNRIPQRVEAAAGEAKDLAGSAIDTGKGLLKRTAGVLKYAPHALIASGGVMLSAMILGTEQTQNFLEKNMTGNLSFVPEMLYQRRMPATFIHLCSGRSLEALGTFAFGGRDAKAKMRHEIYAKYFDVKDKEIWAVSGVTVQELLEADPSREYPLATGFLKHIPFLNKKIAETDLKDVEEKIKAKLVSNMDELLAVDSAIKGKTVDEAIRIAFAEGIFDSLGEEVDDDGTEGAKSVVTSIDGYNEKLDSIAATETLDEAEIETLRKESETLYAELDELRIAMPSEFAELKKAFGSVFPIPMVNMTENLGLVDYENDVDLIATQEFYEQFTDQLQDEEVSSMRKDLEDLQGAKAYFTQLKAGTTPDETLKSHIETMKTINQRLETWKFRAEQSRKESLAADASKFEFGEDFPELMNFYYYGYTGIPKILQWSVEETFNSETNAMEKTVAIAAGVGTAFVASDIGVGLYQVAFTEAKMTGAMRLLAPGPKLTLDVAKGLKNFGHILGYNTPERLLDKVIRGQMSSDEAMRISKIALRHTDKFDNLAWSNRMKGFEDIIQIFDDNGDDIARYLDNPELARAIDESTDIKWQKALRNLVKDTYGETLEEYFKRMKVEKAEALAARMSPEKIARMMNAMAKKMGMAEIPFDDLVRILAEGGPVNNFFRSSLRSGARIGLPAGAALLTAYFACEVVHTGDHTKAEKFAMLGTGLIAAELTIKGALWAKNTAHGAMLASKISKHPGVLLVGAILGLVGVTYVAEEAARPFMKSRNTAAVAFREILGPLTYMGSGGQLIDLGYHYFSNQSEKEYFMRTAYLPTLPWKKGSKVNLAFKDAGVGYFNEMSPQEAINVYNYKQRQEIKKLEEKTPENDVEAAEIEAEITLLSSRIIDHNWVMRQSISFDLSKEKIRENGITLEKKILDQYSDRLLPKERALVSSLLTIDVPHSWMDEEFFDIDDEPRVALIRRLTEEMGIEDEFEEFIASKRSIQSDIQFFQLIDKEDEIVNVDIETKTNRLYASLGIYDEDMEVATEIYEEANQELPEAIAA